jgi:hypothetical protein
MSSRWVPALGELPVVKDGDEAGHTHGGEAVGDEHGGAAVFPSGLRGCGRVALEQVVLGGGVEGRGGLVEYQQQGMLPHQGAGQAHRLPLAAG